MLYIVRATLLLILIIVYTLTFLTSSKGFQMFYAKGYLASLVLMLLAVASLFTGDISAGEFIACILCGTVTGIYFVYRDYMGK